MSQRTGATKHIAPSTSCPELHETIAKAKAHWAPRHPSTGQSLEAVEESDSANHATGSTSPPQAVEPPSPRKSVAGSISCPELHKAIAADKRQPPRDGRVVLTVGCFDMLHRGHVALFKRLMAASDKLVIGVHDDESIKAMKNITTGDKSTKRFSQIQLQLRPQDEAFLIHSTDPTIYWAGGTDNRGRTVAPIMSRLKNEGWHDFTYMRGDDMLQFPGRTFLEAQGVKLVFTPYTKGVSATMMRNSWSLRLRLLPEALANPLLEAHEVYVYQPLRKALERVAAASFFPHKVLPNHVTWASMLCALPFVLLTVYGWHLTAAVLTVFHDLLDRLDGAVAGALRKSPDVRVDGPRVYRKDHVVHDGEYGAYLDAMGDKAFGISALLALALQPGAVSSLPLWFVTVALLKLPLHAALAFTRTQDYRAKLAGKTNVALPAVGFGKLATCSENFGCAVASLALYSDCARVVTLIAGVLGVLSLDMALRSLSHKLRARC
mmetsp:Transcript_10739/g.21772  ORF Transcript_10739/g.21772 Transcript_10739/m.21772 type:complete len:492 (-) Transcript_10739:250-1725(-)